MVRVQRVEGTFYQQTDRSANSLPNLLLGRYGGLPDNLHNDFWR